MATRLIAERLPRHRFTVSEYERLGAAGVLGEYDRVELIEGDIVEMTPIGPRHAWVVDLLSGILRERLGTRAHVRCQNPVRLGADTEPQPDVVVCRAVEYRDRHPVPADVHLVVEVSDTSLFSDRTKMLAYARAGISETWIVDLDSDVVDIHRDPTPEGFRTISRVRHGDRIALAAFADVQIAVDDFLK
jgi:hypothetical protein